MQGDFRWARSGSMSAIKKKERPGRAGYPENLWKAGKKDRYWHRSGDVRLFRELSGPSNCSGFVSS